MEKTKDKLIVIGGATATGKTNIAISLAKSIGGEIISADSMQVYKYMDIGSAKASKEELNEVKHHLIDVFYPDEPFSVFVFKELAIKAIEDITSRGKVPILVGGTGFYINAVIYNNDFTENTSNEEYRQFLYKEAEEKGVSYVHSLLEKLDYESSLTIHENNVKRVIRALDYINSTGMKFSEHNELEKSREPYFDTTFFILDEEREILYDRINKRVDKMFADGLVDEVKFLLDKGYTKDLTSMQGIGYKEVVDYVNGETSFLECSEILKQATRNFAKRQMTWFRNSAKGFHINTNGKNTKQIVDEMLLIKRG